MANESEPAERKAKSEDGPRTVVVAEDEAVNRMDLVAMLEDNGYEVVGQAANGEEAVELTRKYRPDVVIMRTVTRYILAFSLLMPLRTYNRCRNSSLS